MDKQIRKIDTLVKRHLHKSKAEIGMLYGVPSQVLYDDAWFYVQRKHFILRTETVFIFKNDKVNDIIIFEYILWIRLRDLFYNANQTPQYEVVKYY